MNAVKIQKQYYAGIDIGGTKTTVGLFNRDFSVIKTITLPSEPKQGCVSLVSRIGEAYERLLKSCHISREEVACAGVASPGPLNLQKGTIVYIPTMGFRNEPIVDYLSNQLKLPVYLENDTNAAALCESVFGQGKNHSIVVYITISTGVGCGIAIDEKILDGGAFAAGELGHFKVERNGALCPCGGCGCLELYASGTAIAAIASRRSGETVDAKEVFSRARQRQQPFYDVVKEAADYLGYAIAAVYQMIDPDIVVLGGSVTKDYVVFSEQLEQALKKYVQSIPERVCRVTVSQYNGEQVLLGAAYYAAQKDIHFSHDKQ